jgi:hypothetical protein
MRRREPRSPLAKRSPFCGQQLPLADSLRAATTLDRQPGPKLGKLSI